MYILNEEMLSTQVFTASTCTFFLSHTMMSN